MPDLKTTRFERDPGRGAAMEIFYGPPGAPAGEYAPADVTRRLAAETDRLRKAVKLAVDHFGFTEWADPSDKAAGLFLRETLAAATA